jgi:aminopeptidase N
MKKLLTLIAIMLISANYTQAQQLSLQNGAERCSHRKSLGTHVSEKSFRSANAPAHAFDVINYNINIDLVNCLQSPYPNNFVADVTILFRDDSTLSQIVLDAESSSLTIDSVRIDGTSFTHEGQELTVYLDRVYLPGEIAEVRLYYRHLDVYDGAFYASGGFAFTDSEPEGARKWFPCYDKPSDKATTDITAKVPSNARLASNGRLQDSLAEGTNINYHWVSRDPVATYLTVLTARVNYNLNIVNWTNPNTFEVVPIRFYFNNGESLSKLSHIKSIIGDMTTFYSGEFGDHPFEKNGFATLNNEFMWGGMENQTLTSLCPNCWDESLVAHEFAHQWFGDMVTCATWADIFLNEGFATWAEAHWTETQFGYQSYKDEMQSNAYTYFSGNPHWAISSPSWAVTTPELNTLFNYSITYMKGSCVMHMLRYTLGDSVFFPALKAYATDTVDFKYRSATIEDFKNKMETESGQQLDWFFDEWIYKPDHPVYNNVYGIYPGTPGNWSVMFTARQENQPFLPYFQMPIELKINFKDGTDTLVRVFNSFNDQNFVFEFDKEPALVIFDPNNDILLKDGTTVVGISPLAETASAYSLKSIPNPFINTSLISFSLKEPSFVRIELYNSVGDKIRTISENFQTSGDHSIPLNSDGLKAGTYFVVLRTSKLTETVKIVKAL